MSFREHRTVRELPQNKDNMHEYRLENKSFIQRFLLAVQHSSTPLPLIAIHPSKTNPATQSLSIAAFNDTVAQKKTSLSLASLARG